MSQLPTSADPDGVNQRELLLTLQSDAKLKSLEPLAKQTHQLKLLPKPEDAPVIHTTLFCKVSSLAILTSYYLLSYAA